MEEKKRTSKGESDERAWETTPREKGGQGQGRECEGDTRAGQTLEVKRRQRAGNRTASQEKLACEKKK